LAAKAGFGAAPYAELLQVRERKLNPDSLMLGLLREVS
jgi:hypothetical protein